MNTKWDVLLVDDEPDVHEVTKLALKRQQWRKRRFNIVSAYSSLEAETIIKERARPFHMAFIDVMMETSEAGLELCRFIRASCPSSFRIVLRTGQPGIAPEQRVLNEYDIDQYLAKGDATPERLYSALTTSLRASSDISTLLAYADQLQSFTKSLHSALDVADNGDAGEITSEDLASIMRESTSFLEEKHGIKILFINDANDVLKGNVPQSLQRSANGSNLDAISQALLHAHQQGQRSLQAADSFGLPSKSFIRPVEVLTNTSKASENERGFGRRFGALLKGILGAEVINTGPDPVAGGFYVECSEKLPPNGVCELERDMNLFSDNWKIAAALRFLQDKVVKERSAALEVVESYVIK